MLPPRLHERSGIIQQVGQARVSAHAAGGSGKVDGRQQLRPAMTLLRRPAANPADAAEH